MKKSRWLLFTLILVCLALVLPISVSAAVTSNETGTHGGYNYEFWKDTGGSGSMTLNSGGTFSAEWSNVGNILFRKGKKFDETQSHQQIGNMSIDFGANYQPNGNSYLTVYGWTVDPLVEFYIVESWGNWRPPGATAKGTINVDGGTYDIYETTRTNQPSIRGTQTFQQYWSVRRSKRTSGTISVSEHFKKWESLGMEMGNMYEVALTVEGYQSSGSADVYRNNLTIGGSSGGGGNDGGGSGGDGGSGNATVVQAESMSKSGQYTGNISSPFNGVALYANNDSVKYTQYFSSGTHSFSLRGASNNSNMARVDLRIGGQYKGTFYYGGSYPAVYTIDNVSHGTGNQEIELIVTSDDGNWDAFVDYLEIN
ncbi:glycoside hydrolase family 11 protein [Aquibacillus koreensis]|uniref:Endo-1,4-beta-xylanase n=1 Tax=Aquibacillus koreensis TaxID=279446 RepID=A0A9X3WJ73_9BACI|nr:glycoside hydrolase family 11 protein [Aquibacillus koreensis]MCT2537109.1 glycoside hydrolase family 11 protein [Aquibacillus koreensis]MDC3419908.1 glycoside hydrolase family 11 protein [Aquibacillus koreensis]